MNKNLEERISRLEDIEAIKQLKARYCEACDDDNNPEKVAATFADDGIWDGGDFGKAVGREAIVKLFEGFQQAVDFSQHNVMNPIIEINGDHATGVWYLIGSVTYHEHGDSKMVTSRYDDEYVKIDGEWKHQHLRAKLRLLTRIDEAR